MRVSKCTKIASLLGIAILCHACASTPNDNAAGAIADDFGDDSLDLLFATEFPVASKDEALAKAALAYRDHDFGKAQFYLVRALKFDVTDVDVLAKIGNLHVMQGNGVLAARAFNFALQNDPNHAQSLEGLGLLYFQAKIDNKAREILERAVENGPNLWRAYNALGIIADRDGDFDQALTYYNAALKIQPLADSILINRGYSKYLGKNYHEAALDFYEVAKRSDSPKAWRNLGMVYARQGWYESALETFLEVIDSPDAHNEIGAIAMENGDTEEALHYLNEAVRLSPTYFSSAEENLADLRRSSKFNSPN